MLSFVSKLFSGGPVHAGIPPPSLQAQMDLLKHFVPSNVNIEYRRSKNGINYAVFEQKQRRNKGDDDKTKPDGGTLLLLHGFGSGLGFFYANYDQLTRIYSRVIAVDWLGMGASHRPESAQTKLSLSSLAYHHLTGSTDRQAEQTVPKAVSFFVDSLDDMIETEKEVVPPSFHLAGHSLGAYLCTHYALQHQQKVKSLVLVSPCGVPAHPPIHKRLTRGDASFGMNLVRLFWETNGTPQQVVRAADLLGLEKRKGFDLISGALHRRFKQRWNEQELGLISRYLYEITAAPPSSEYALNSLLVPMSFREERSGVELISGSVFAKQPLEHEMQKLNKIPLLLLFGDNDWLRFHNVEEVVSKWRQEQQVNCTFQVIGESGHHLYLDNPVEFAQSLEAFHKRVVDEDER